jgi:hypothetical protein
MAVIMGFSAEIRGVEYPAVAIFKLNKGAANCWYGDHPTDGHLAVYDLVEQKRHFVSGSFNVHGSRHRDGSRHQVLEPSGREKIYLSPRTVKASKDSLCDHIREVNVPLFEPFDFWPIKNPVWNATTSRQVLRRDDFGQRVDGVILQGFMCRHEYVKDLLAEQKTAYRSWVENDGDFDLVVLAEVRRIPATDAIPPSADVRELNGR